MTNELFDTQHATADVNGRAEVSTGPLRAFEKWTVRRMSVSSSSSTLIPTCKIYRGAQLVDGTYTGTLDHSDTNLQMQNGEQLRAIWEGADVGATCTLGVEGDVYK